MKKLIIALALALTAGAVHAEDAIDLRTNAELAAHEMREQMFAASADAPELKGISDDQRRLSLMRVMNEYTAQMDNTIAAELAQGRTCADIVPDMRKGDRDRIATQPKDTGFVIARGKYLKNKCELIAKDMP